MVHVTSEELMVLVAKGDDEAFADLYTRVVGPVFRVVRRTVLDPAQSEEVTQEVLVELWRTATRYDPDRGTVLNWVLMLAHRRAVDRVRLAQAMTRRDRLFCAMSVDPAFDDVTEAVGVRLEYQQVRLCLAVLTDLQRESIMLVYYAGYNTREIAELLDTPVSTVKTRLRDGLIRLRACVDAPDDDERDAVRPDRGGRGPAGPR
jgi:RNA polymerase sigma-70 factor (ECF subfamily)